MASKGVNKAIIVGNLGNDPEMRYMPNGNAVVSISIATSESWTDKTTGQPQERTEWHRVEAFGKLAEIMGQYLRKGSQVYIEGSIRTDKWEDQKTGETKYSTKIRADQMQILGGRQDGANNATTGNSTVANNAPVQQFAPPASPADDFSDDIPF